MKRIMIAGAVVLLIGVGAVAVGMVLAPARDLEELEQAYEKELLAAQEQIAEAREALIRESQDPDVVRGLSEGRSGLESLMVERIAQTASLKVKADRLRTQLRDAESEIDKINRDEVELAQLQRKVDLASVNYHTYAEKLEQARIDLLQEKYNYLAGLLDLEYECNTPREELESNNED